MPKAARVLLPAACLVALTGCVPPPPPPPPGNTNDNVPRMNTRFAGADTCRVCHSPDHADWVATAHARAFDALVDVGQDQNAECLPCHTVGFGKRGGFVDFASTARLAGVQCESCHGPALEHASDPLDRSLLPSVSTDPSDCGRCHTDYHHPVFEQWRESQHARALEAVRADGRGTDDCLTCHSADYRDALRNGAARPSIATAEFGVTCNTCHAPHGGTREPAQLRVPIASLCTECHTQRGEVAFGDDPHNPQLDMLLGTGARDADGGPLAVEHSHTSIADSQRSCARCHVVSLSVDDPNHAPPAAIGHTFNPFDAATAAAHPADEIYAGCLPCHAADDADALRAARQTSVEARLEILAPYFRSSSERYIDPASLDSDADRATLETARFNYRFVETDGSLGVHNPAYADQLLTIAEQLLAELAP